MYARLRKSEYPWMAALIAASGDAGLAEVAVAEGAALGVFTDVVSTGDVVTVVAGAVVQPARIVRTSTAPAALRPCLFVIICDLLQPLESEKGPSYDPSESIFL